MSNIDDKIAELERQIELLKSLKKADDSAEPILPIAPKIDPYQDPLQPYRDLMPKPYLRQPDWICPQYPPYWAIYWS